MYNTLSPNGLDALWWSDLRGVSLPVNDLLHINVCSIALQPTYVVACRVWSSTRLKQATSFPSLCYAPDRMMSCKSCAQALHPHAGYRHDLCATVRLRSQATPTIIMNGGVYGASFPVIRWIFTRDLWPAAGEKLVDPLTFATRRHYTS